MNFDFNAISIECTTTKVPPPRPYVFILTPFEPDRAGIIAHISFIFNSKFYNHSRA